MRWEEEEREGESKKQAGGQKRRREKGPVREKKETNGREREKSSRGEEKVLDINKENMYERGSFNNLSLSQTCYSGSAVIFFFFLKKCINWKSNIS